MTENKLDRDRVPEKFADWLLAMGCPPEKVPTVDKISQMCRGTYYLVWRNLMEQVESKNTITGKRLQVFADDVRRCKNKNLFREQDTNVLIPPELTVWKQQVEVMKKVAQAEVRVAEARRNLHELMDKVSSKISQRNLSRQRVQDQQRRTRLLQLLAEDLQSKTHSLKETRAIAEDMCCINEHTDVQAKLNNCLSSARRQSVAVASSTLISNRSSSVIGNGDVDEEQITQLVQCRGDALWSELYARRAALVSSLTNKTDSASNGNKPGFQTVLAHTAALQCSLALEALKCREMMRLTQTRLGDAVNDLNPQLSSESCELLVLQCERAGTEAKVNALTSLLEDITGRSGVFRTTDESDMPGARGRIDKLDKAIESKKEEMKTTISSLAMTERKIQFVRDCLASIFNGFSENTPAGDGRNRGIQLDLPTESIASLRQFYGQRREKRRNRMELSLEFDVSDNSFNDNSDLTSARFVDELKIYLKKFNLEKNRKLVLESGEKIWIFETLRSSVSRLHSKWLTEDVACGLLCPSMSVPRNVLRLAKAVELRNGLKGMGSCSRDIDVDIDINKHTDEEDRIIDNIKKRLDENLRSLQKSSKTLEQGKENLNLWSGNKIKNHISNRRTVDGKTFKAYEAYYLESLNF